MVGKVVRASSTVRITSVPPGEAPLWVREKWVGLELPISGLPKSRTYLTTGVITGPKSLLGSFSAILRGRTKKVQGYRVSSEAALAALEDASPNAVAWWRANAPQYFKPGKYLVFHASACTPLPSIASPRERP